MCVTSFSMAPKEPAKKIAVITPTTGSRLLRQAIASVAAQTYPHVTHYIVIDGQERAAAAQRIIAETGFAGKVITLPEPTGKNNYFGHRIYGSIPILVDADFVGFLDEDNWLEPQHFELLMEQISSSRLDWAYALRNVVTEEGEPICQDNCQSLGWWPAYDGAYHFIDTNCYLVSRPLLIEASNLWNRQGYIASVRDPDRELCRWLMHRSERGFTSGAYTVNYRLPGGKIGQLKRGFFEVGNQVFGGIYARFPWSILMPNPGSPEVRHLEFMARDRAEALRMREQIEALRL